MQTFVPFPDLVASAEVLDTKRLVKQLLEGRQVYGILSAGKTKGPWTQHPAVKMWRCYDNGLYVYLEAIKDECVRRGYKTEKNWTAIEQMHENNWNRGGNVVMPPWWGDYRVHESHKYNLYQKDPIHYAQFSDAQKITCCDRCNYFWSSHTLFYNNEFLGYVV